MATVRLANLDARLTFLALQYHLERPGSELDPETKQPGTEGLRPVAEALEPQLDRAVASIDLSERQQTRLISAIAGAINELKAYPLMAGGARSTVPAFEAALRRLFPEVVADPDEATQLAGHLLAVRRRLGQATLGEEAGPAAAPAGGPWWWFWRRRG